MINKNESFINVFKTKTVPSSTERDLGQAFSYFKTITKKKDIESSNRKSSSRLDWKANFKPSGVSSYLAASEPAAKQEETRRVITFLLFLTPTGQEILPQLVQLMKAGTKPQDFAIMLFALQDFGYLNRSIEKIQNVSLVHRALQETFGPKVGSRENLRKNIKRLQNANANDEVLIKAEKERIKKFIRNT